MKLLYFSLKLFEIYITLKLQKKHQIKISKYIKNKFNHIESKTENT